VENEEKKSSEFRGAPIDNQGHRPVELNRCAVVCILSTHLDLVFLISAAFAV
jgi:hypothetical protein